MSGVIASLPFPEQFMPFNLSVVLKSDFHQLNRVFQCVSDFNGELVVNFTIILNSKRHRLNAPKGSTPFDPPS
jgi:hypothetical protein